MVKIHEMPHGRHVSLLALSNHRFLSHCFAINTRPLLQAFILRLEKRQEV